MEKITGEFIGRPNIETFIKTLCMLVGEQNNVTITVKSITKKEDAKDVS